MFMEERHEKILEMLAKGGRVNTADMQKEFEISFDTARRDLRILEEKGLLKRTHGGAIPLRKVAAAPPRQRDYTNMEIFPNYAAIAKRAAALVQKDEVVYLTSGSLGFIMLSYLPKDIPFTLVLNSVTLAEQLKYWDNITVYITGGKMRMHGTTSLVDSFAAAFVKNMHFDLCLMTGAGGDASFGLSNGTDETATFQRAVLNNSRRKVLMLPGEKIGFRAFIKVCPMETFDTLITDWEAPEDALVQIEETGVSVIVAEEEN